MSFPREIIVGGIAIADQLTLGVQSTVQWEAFLSETGNGDETFDTPKPLTCVLDQTRKQAPTPSGRLITVIATLTFPRGGLNINPRDRITLPDGTTGPLIMEAPNAVFDPVTGRGFVTEVKIAEQRSKVSA